MLMSGSHPADAGCNSDFAQYSNTPSLRVARFEDEDEDENEAPGERFRSSYPPIAAEIDASFGSLQPLRKIGMTSLRPLLFWELIVPAG
jgi:hypothetical protein